MRPGPPAACSGPRSRPRCRTSPPMAARTRSGSGPASGSRRPPGRPSPQRRSRPPSSVRCRPSSPSTTSRIRLVELLADVVGATAYAAGRAPHIAGITASGATLTIRLTHPAGDFPVRLRLVVLLSGPGRNAGDRAAAARRRPSPWPALTASPPRAAARSSWSATRTTPATALAGSRASSTPTASRRPRRSRASSTGAPTTSAATRSPPTRRTHSRSVARSIPRSASPAARGARAAHATCRVRRPGSTGSRSTRSGRSSATSACDVQSLTRSIGARSRPSTASYPPTVSSPRPSMVRRGNIAYPDEPDLVTARRLAGHGARRNATLYGCGDPTGRRIAQILRSNLAEIGIDVHVDESLQCLTGPKPEQLAAADIQLVTGLNDVLDPASFVELPLGNPYTAPGYWKNARLRTRIEKARATLGRARVAAYTQARADARTRCGARGGLCQFRQPRVLLGARRLQALAGRAQLSPTSARSACAVISRCRRSSR